MSTAPQLSFMDNVIPFPGVTVGRGGFGGERKDPFPPRENQNQDLDQEPLTEEQTEKQRFDQIWEVCVDLLGYKPITETEKGLWGRRVWSLTRAGVTADDVYQSGLLYRQRWQGIDLTINAVEKWLSHFLADVRKKQQHKAEVCPACGVGGGHHVADCTTLD